MQAQTSLVIATWCWIVVRYFQILLNLDEILPNLICTIIRVPVIILTACRVLAYFCSSYLPSSLTSTGAGLMIMPKLSNVTSYPEHLN
jgi:hypothetical protein